MAGLPKRVAMFGCGLLLAGVSATASAEVVVVVSVASPVERLSRTELADIYLDRRDRLPNGDPVIPIDQAENSTAHDEFYAEYLGRSASQIKAHWSKLIFTGRGMPPKTVPDGAAMAEVVAENPNAIGYVYPGFVDDRLRIVSIE